MKDSLNLIYWITRIESSILNILDSSGSPVTETIQSVVVTDASGNPVTGM